MLQGIHIYIYILRCICLSCTCWLFNTNNKLVMYLWEWSTLMVFARQWQWRLVQKHNLFEATGNRCLLTSSNEQSERKNETSFDIMQHQDMQTRPPEIVANKKKVFQEWTNINQWIYQQHVDIISNGPGHTTCTWTSFLRSDNPPTRNMYKYIYIHLYM